MSSKYFKYHWQVFRILKKYLSKNSHQYSEDLGMRDTHKIFKNIIKKK